ncbi:MAG: outer membrane protein assembly factor BamD [Chitinispirillaceae bacterium]|nr:outer membrane protein assembly factor BamD [Chitinispirillaceae bacterium]
MKKTIFFVSTFIFIISIALLSGCSNITMLRTKELRAVKTEVDSLRKELISLQKTMYEEQKAQTELIRLLRADQETRLSTIERKIAEISSNVAETQYHLSTITQKTVEVNKKLEAKFAADSINNTNRKTEAEKLFQIAMSDFTAGRYDIASKGFKDVASRFPESPLASEAEYWIAECSYAKKDYNSAEEDYIIYIKKYPQGSKLCVALYKLGLTYEKQNKIKSKNMVWKKALEQCPDSPEVQVIKSYLKE